MSFFSRLRSFDVYRDIPAELSEQTTTGGIISLTAIVVLLYLTLSEFSLYLHGTTTHQLVIEQPRLPPSSSSASLSNALIHQIDQSLSVTVHLNMTFYHIPCVALGVEVQDLFGSLGQASDKGLVRFAVDEWGRVKGDRTIQRLSNDMNDMQKHVGEGCNIFGTISIESVPGNFHFIPGLSYQQLALFYDKQFINTSHSVHYLYFGDLLRKQVKHEKIPIVMDSLHDHTRLVMDDESAENHEKHLSSPSNGPISAGVGPPPPSRFHFSKSFEYYLRIVPTMYSSSPSHTVQTYQYTSHANDVLLPRQLPAIYFRYDFSPITIKIGKTYHPFAHFLVEVCAIVGGVFTVLRMIHAALKTMGQRKQERGGGGGGASGGEVGAGVEQRFAASSNHNPHTQQPYQGLSVQAPLAEMPHNWGMDDGQQTPSGARPLLSPELRSLVSPTHQPVRQHSAPAVEGQWSNGNSSPHSGHANHAQSYGVQGNGYGGSQYGGSQQYVPQPAPVHQRQVHGMTSKQYGGHND